MLLISDEGSGDSLVPFDGGREFLQLDQLNFVVQRRNVSTFFTGKGKLQGHEENTLINLVA